MRAVKGSLATPLGAKWGNLKASPGGNGTSRRASGWAGEKVARSGRPSRAPSREGGITVALLLEECRPDDGLG